MSIVESRKIKTGSDPRLLPDYSALRDELLKLSHPARPDVDWKYAWTLCLRLFEHNGVELQTAAWFTLARTHIAGLAGMNEGLALINALIAHQWSVMWPAGAHVRMEIINGLSQRLQIVLRTLALDERGDLPVLYQAEKHLTTLSETLARHDLKQGSRTEMLLLPVKQAITRLENSPHNEGYEPAVVLPAQAINAITATNPLDSERLVYVIQAEPGVDVVMAPRSGRRRFIGAFIAGACGAVLVCGILLWGWKIWHTSSPAEQQLLATLTPLPDTLSAQQLASLRQSSLIKGEQSGNLAAQTQEQLKWLRNLSPDWSLQYGQNLISQANTLLPGERAIAQIQKDWQEQLAMNALQPTELNGWSQGMTKLQQLADRLNTLDEKRGKYMTVSELKSAVFEMLTRFRQTVPIEEQLRLIHLQPSDSPARQQQIQKTEQHLQVQTNMLMQEKQRYAAEK